MQNVHHNGFKQLFILLLLTNTYEYFNNVKSCTKLTDFNWNFCSFPATYYTYFDLLFASGISLNTGWTAAVAMCCKNEGRLPTLTPPHGAYKSTDKPQADLHTRTGRPVLYYCCFIRQCSWMMKKILYRPCKLYVLYNRFLYRFQKDLMNICVLENP